MTLRGPGRVVVDLSHPFHGYGKTGMLISSLQVDARLA